MMYEILCILKENFGLLSEMKYTKNLKVKCLEIYRFYIIFKITYILELAVILKNGNRC